MTTNYFGTFISIAPDSTATEAVVPQPRGGKPTVASLQHELLSAAPHALTSDELLFRVYAIRNGVDESDTEERERFFSKSLACLRASPLPKSYGWGLLYDPEGRIRLVGVDTPEYEELRADPELEQLAAMRSKRA